ncbi:glycoside hydrolase family 9 protein [Larkinella sp. VNQ87]|uniref:glycoside hydrolase family 9 protein n=1 Tax=Larkinella sp. VNQ87 TaxID=3400921 RepID=UPI003C041E39
MRKLFLLLGILAGVVAFKATPDEQAWIRTNYLGYRPASKKIAVWVGKTTEPFAMHFQVIEATTGKAIFEGPVGKDFGAYGPFVQTYRLDFSAVRKPGRYYLKTGAIQSPEFRIADDVYNGTADFCLRYMRQQRSGYNPFLKDSCHTHDGYTMYGPMPDSTHIDVSGGWHDASDYLQYVTTSANATYHLLAAFRDFPKVFGDQHQANGLEGPNNQADVLDEARWGLDWLLKMHPKDDWMFNQLADDRDHSGLRIPKRDSAYGKGYERPVYFATGKPQGLFKHKNRATGVASTAGKFSSAFALGYQVLRRRDEEYADKLWQRAQTAYTLGLQKPGVSQTAPGRAPYFYEEDNYVDDMELAAVELYNAARVQGYKAGDYLNSAYAYGLIEPVTPWLGADTARHYQWYPFINIGHYEVAKRLVDSRRQHIIGFYRSGIEKVWQKAQQNAFYRGVPFIWCSNNLTTSFAIQCYWYRKLTGDNRYLPLEQACFDWLFGCNPWGTSFVYGLPAGADTPADPHSAFTHLHQYPIDGGLVDGPVYGRIYKNLIGIELKEPDEYEAFQSDLVVYHDDYGDYSTNEPTMDGTASLVYLLAAKQGETNASATVAAPAKAKVVKKKPAGRKTVRKKSSGRKKAPVRRSSGSKKKQRRR